MKPGVSDALVSQIDLLRSLATLTGARLSGGAAPDSDDVLRALLGSSQHGRQFLVEHSGGLSLRDGQWKYIEPANGPAITANTDIDTGNSPEPQLYNLAADIGEKNNLAKNDPSRVKALSEKLASIRRRDGRGRGQ